MNLLSKILMFATLIALCAIFTNYEGSVRFKLGLSDGFSFEINGVKQEPGR